MLLGDVDCGITMHHEFEVPPGCVRGDAVARGGIEVSRPLSGVLASEFHHIDPGLAGQL